MGAGENEAGTGQNCFEESSRDEDVVFLPFSPYGCGIPLTAFGSFPAHTSLPQEAIVSAGAATFVPRHLLPGLLKVLYVRLRRGLHC